MTDSTPPPHLDDEDLSALLDGEAGTDVAAHVAGCAACAGRRDTLVTARDAVRAAAVAPLPASVLDGLVGTALDAAAGTGASDAPGPEPAGAVPLERPRSRRLTTPPPAWLLGAVASIAVVAGLAGLLRSGGGGDDSSFDAAGRALPRAGVAASNEESAGDEGSDADRLAAAVDPELVTADLGDVADAAALTRALDAPTDQAFSAGRAVAGAADGTEGAPREVTPVPPVAAGGAGGTATASAPPSDRAQCLVEAERAGAGRLGPLQATATLRFEGRPAEVLVFALAEPAGGFSRQALVLARPGCELLADPRL